MRREREGRRRLEDGPGERAAGVLAPHDAVLALPDRDRVRPTAAR